MDDDDGDQSGSRDRRSEPLLMRTQGGASKGPFCHTLAMRMDDI